MRYLVLFACFFALFSPPLEAAYLYKSGKWINTKEAAWMSVQEHYAAAMDAYQNKNWVALVRHTLIVTTNFPETPFAEEANFYLGVGYFELHDFELANKQFSSYLKKQAAPKHFEKAIEYKFQIAEKFEGGARKHMMGFKSLPQWIPAKREALNLYDEVITALPNHELAAKALFGKGRLQLDEEEFTAAVESFQTLIRRFPKHPLSPQSYLMIAKTYLAQVKEEYTDPDMLDLAEINLKKYATDFPSDERIEEGRGYFLKMQELYAEKLYTIGKFYLKTKKPKAAQFYFAKVLSKFPETKIADEVRNLQKTNPLLQEVK